MPGRVLLRGGHILSIDPSIGVLPVGDILVEGDAIAQVAERIDVDDADVVDVSGHIIAPGMVDTHRHTWQTQMRAICGDWTLIDYFFGIRLTISPAYTPSDLYLGNKLGAVEALSSGVTTILDFSHCNNTPEHSDAAVTGLRDAGIRATFGYGFFDSSPYAPQHFADHAARVADFDRIADTYFAEPGLLSLGVALTEVGMIPFSLTQNEVAAARRRGALIVNHTACVWSMPTGFREMAHGGVLGSDVVHVHCNALDDDEWRELAASGGKVSISPETELNMGMGRLVFAQCERHGVKPTLSCDVISLNSGDLLSQARLGLAFKRWSDTEPLNLAGGDPTTISTTALEALEWATINGADALGMADRIGSITPGKQADLMIVGGGSIQQHPHIDAASTLIFQTSPDDVRHVLVAGRFVKRDGTMVDHDVAALNAEADRSASEILRRVEAAGRTLPGSPGDIDNIVAGAIANLQA